MWKTLGVAGFRMEYSSAVSVRDYIDLFDKAALQIESRQEGAADDSSRTDDDDEREPHGDGQDDVRAAYHPVVAGQSQCQAGGGLR